VLIELDQVDRITADAVGPPGHRTFFLQARRGDQVVTVMVEKEQVQLLAASVLEILARVGKETGQGSPEEEMGLDQPVLPEWRAGRISIGYHEPRDLLVLEADEIEPDQEGGEEEAAGEGGEAAALGPEGLGPRLFGEGLEEGAEEEVEDDEDDLATGEDADAEPSPDLGRVRFWATREQMLSLARHGAQVCAAGRPLCPLCHNPMDPEGHQCPALNGHRRKAET
jgi:uncharacterized repeat protein (TIGR03847 family)